MGELVRTLYRQILRVATRIDRAPGSKALLFIHDSFLANGLRRASGRGAPYAPSRSSSRSNFSGSRGHAALLEESNKEHEHKDGRPKTIEEALQNFMGGSVYYHPFLRKERHSGHLSLRQLVRDCFRLDMAQGVNCEVSGHNEERPTPEARCFLALRVLNIVAASIPVPDDDPRSFVWPGIDELEDRNATTSSGIDSRRSSSTATSASTDTASSATTLPPTYPSFDELRTLLSSQGVDCDAVDSQAAKFHAISPQQGVLSGDFIHAHPCLVQGTLTRALICLTSHDDHSGSIGVVTNSPSSIVLDDSSEISLAAFSAHVQEAFAGKRIWAGGGVGLGQLYCVTSKRTKSSAKTSGSADSDDCDAEEGSPQSNPNIPSKAKIEGFWGRETEQAVSAGSILGKSVADIEGLELSFDIDEVASEVLTGELSKDDVRLFTGYVVCGMRLRRDK